MREELDNLDREIKRADRDLERFFAKELDIQVESDIVAVFTVLAAALVIGYTVALSAGILAITFYFLSPAWSVPLAVVIAATIGALMQWKRQ